MYSRLDGFNDEDKCPWCAAQLGDVWEYFHRGSHEAAFTCPECEQEIVGEIECTTWLKRDEPEQLQSEESVNGKNEF